jgi:heat shock protein HslJ
MLAAASALISILLAATLLAQTPPRTGTEPPIPPVVWEPVEITAPSNGLPEIAELERYSVQFLPEGRLVAEAGCNQVIGIYTTGNDSLALDITLSDSTLAHCPSDVHSEQFLELLDTVADFEIDPDGFLIVRGDQGLLWLLPALTGVVWEWQDVRGGDDSLVAPSNPHEYTLTFMPDGELQILASCVRTLGAYTVDGPILELSFDGPTRAECGPGSLAERYLRDLGDVSSHVFRDGNLFLAMRADAGIMAFAARPAEPLPATPQTGQMATDSA